MEAKTLGTYTYKHPTYTNGVREYVEHQLRVEVVGERANKYRVKYNGFHASGAAPGTLHNVRKDKVRLDTHIVVDANGAQLSEEAAEQVRTQIGLKWLPYKDD